MIFEPTAIPGVLVIEVEAHRDARGYFARTFCVEEFRRQGIAFETVQCNVSLNRMKGTLRGLHYQAAPAGEPKLVRCTRGRLFDVAVDLRPESPASCNWTALEMSAEAPNALFIPEGCAHGFITLEDDTEIFYQMGSLYTPDLARGVRWNDPAFAIGWPMQPSVISERDAGYPDYRPLASHVGSS